MKKTIQENKVTFVLIALFIVLIGCYVPSIELGVQGDGKEYILQTVAFENHFSFGIKEADLREAMQEFINEAETLEYLYYSKNVPMHSSGNARYSNHYGSYSALVMPVKQVLLAFGVYPLWAFTVTNFILWVAAVLVVFFCLKTDAKRKFCIVLLTVCNPIVYYLNWTHSEMYIFSFMVIGLVFYYNKQYGLSILFTSVAAMQNLGVLPFAMMVGIDYIIQCILAYCQEYKTFKLFDFIKRYYKRILPYGAFYIPAILPIVSTYIRFGTYNLVAEVALENKYILDKAWDYLFDWNLGIFPYEPILLIVFTIMIVIGIKKNTRISLVNLFGVGGMLYIIAHQIQINSGMQGIMRYCVWIIPSIIFFVIMNWPNGTKRKEMIMVGIGTIQALFTSVLLVYCIWGGGAYDYCHFAPWTEVILDTAPQLYNPSHGIFYTRAENEEKYHSYSPVVYCNEAGYVRKILLSDEAEHVFYSDEFVLTDQNGHLIDKTLLKTKQVDEGEYTYINIQEDIEYAYRYNMGEMIYFHADEYNAEKFVRAGVSYKEGWGSWTDGDVFVMHLQIETDVPFIKGHIDIGDTFYQAQEVTILINEEDVFKERIEGDQDIDFVFENPKDGRVEMIMLLPNSISPSEVMDSKDSRDLALGLLTIEFYDETR